MDRKRRASTTTTEDWSSKRLKEADEGPICAICMEPCTTNLGCGCSAGICCLGCAQKAGMHNQRLYTKCSVCKRGYTGQSATELCEMWVRTADEDDRETLPTALLALSNARRIIDNWSGTFTALHRCKEAVLARCDCHATACRQKGSALIRANIEIVRAYVDYYSRIGPHVTVFGDGSRIQVNHPPQAPAEKIDGPLYSLIEAQGLTVADKACVLMLRGIVQFSRQNNKAALSLLRESLRFSHCRMHKTHVLGVMIQLLLIESRPKHAIAIGEKWRKTATELNSNKKSCPVRAGLAIAYMEVQRFQDAIDILENLKPDRFTEGVIRIAREKLPPPLPTL